MPNNSSNAKYVISGVIILLLIPVATMAIQSTGNPISQDNIPVGSEDNSNVLWEYNGDNVLASEYGDNVWADHISNDNYKIATETIVSQPLPSWLQSLLLILIPLAMGASAIYSFTRISS